MALAEQRNRARRPTSSRRAARRTRKNERKPDPRARGAPLAADGNPGAAEEVERRLAADHGEHHVVRQRSRSRRRRSPPARRPSRTSVSFDSRIHAQRAEVRAAAAPCCRRTRCSRASDVGSSTITCARARSRSSWRSLSRFSGLQARELLLAVAERHVRARHAQRHRRSRAPSRRRRPPAPACPCSLSGRRGGGRPCRASRRARRAGGSCRCGRWR